MCLTRVMKACKQRGPRSTPIPFLVSLLFGEIITNIKDFSIRVLSETRSVIINLIQLNATAIIVFSSLSSITSPLQRNEGYTCCKLRLSFSICYGCVCLVVLAVFRCSLRTSH